MWRASASMFDSWTIEQLVVLAGGILVFVACVWHDFLGPKFNRHKRKADKWETEYEAMRRRIDETLTRMEPRMEKKVMPKQKMDVTDAVIKRETLR